jgi:hypothetical protein
MRTEVVVTEPDQFGIETRRGTSTLETLPFEPSEADAFSATILVWVS